MPAQIKKIKYMDMISPSKVYLVQFKSKFSETCRSVKVKEV